MTGPGPQHEHGCGEDVAPWLLGALTREDADRFQHHLAGCTLCQADVARLKPAVDALPVTPDLVEPPRELKRRIMAEVHASLPPAPVPERAAARRPSWLRPLPALAAACTLLVAGVGVGVIASDGGPDRVVPGQIAMEGASTELELHDGDGTLKVSGMKAAPGDRVYQVWLMRGEGPPQPTDALFNPNSDGRATVDVPGDLEGVDRVLVSEEPRGGSRSPTTAPAIDIRLTSN